MISANVPLAYAIRNNGNIHLFILIYSGSQRPHFPETGLPSGKKILYVVNTTGAGSTRHFMNYSFPVDSLTDIEIVCNGTDAQGNSFQHFRRIELVDVEPFIVPTPPFNIPYAYTQKVPNDDDRFKAELVFLPNPSIQLRCEHSGPTPSDTNTFSRIIPDNTSPQSELEEQHIFTVKNFFGDKTDGGHNVEFTGSPKSKGKTKNRNHSPTPFPGHIK